MKLDPTVRSSLAAAVVRSLENGAPGSTATLRGSLADGSADEYSDIDLCWEVPDELLLSCVNGLREHLSQVRCVASLRSAPELQNSEKHRLVFVQFAGGPLFWRVDIEVFARSIQRNPGYDLGNDLARGDDWSPTHSALMNAVAAVKAVLRGHEAEALSLLRRGFERVGRPVPDGTAQHQISQLAEQVAQIDPEQVDLAAQVQALCRDALSCAGRR